VLYQFQDITTRFFTFSGGAFLLQPVTYARHCTAYIISEGPGSVLVMDSEYSLTPVAQPTSTGSGDASATPQWTEGWNPPTVEPSCMYNCPTWSPVTYHATCQTQGGYEYLHCTAAMSAPIPWGHLLLVYFHVHENDPTVDSAVIWGWPQRTCYASWGTESGYCMGLGASDLSDVSFIAEETAPATPERTAGWEYHEGMENPNPPVLCGNLAATTVDGTCSWANAVTWLQTGAYWLVSRNLSEEQPYPGYFSQPFTPTFVGAFMQYGSGSSVFTVDIQDYGQWTGQQPTPAPSVTVGPTQPTYPYPSSSASVTPYPTWDGSTSPPGGGSAPGKGGNGVPGGGSGPECRPAPLSGECKTPQVSYGLMPDCAADWWNPLSDAAYLGCLIGSIPTAMANAVAWLANVVIDLAIPGHATQVFLESTSNEFGGFLAPSGVGPGTYTASAVSAGEPFSLVWEMGPPLNVTLDLLGALSVAMTAMAPIRGILAAALWFSALLGLVGWLPGQFLRMPQ
jgi:hypothetical protein